MAPKTDSYLIPAGMSRVMVIRIEAVFYLPKTRQESGSAPTVVCQKQNCEHFPTVTLRTVVISTQPFGEAVATAVKYGSTGLKAEGIHGRAVHNICQNSLSAKCRVTSIPAISGISSRTTPNRNAVQCNRDGLTTWNPR